MSHKMYTFIAKAWEVARTEVRLEDDMPELHEGTKLAAEAALEAGLLDDAPLLNPFVKDIVGRLSESSHVYGKFVVEKNSISVVSPWRIEDVNPHTDVTSMEPVYA
ncbi:hypothetical protein Dimus_000459 [Dionaea muscipula]